MTGLEIGLLIIGAVFFVGSFFVSEKLSSSDMSEIEGLSENEIQVLLDRKLKETDARVEETISKKIDEKNEEFAAGADKETNNRIMSIGEYADSVFDSMNKTHEEILFMYQMLNDKQESLTELTKTLGEAESHVRELLTESERQKELLDRRAEEKEPEPAAYVPEISPEEPEKPEPEKNVPTDTADSIPEESALPKESALEKHSAKKKEEHDKADTKKVREKVINMYHQGYSVLDIAKETGKGMGEIQLILELFDDKEEASS